MNCWCILEHKIHRYSGNVQYFCGSCFCQFRETVHFFYENHFGIIDVEETMVVDEMVIF